VAEMVHNAAENPGETHCSNFYQAEPTATPLNNHTTSTPRKSTSHGVGHTPLDLTAGLVDTHVLPNGHTIDLVLVFKHRGLHRQQDRPQVSSDIKTTSEMSLMQNLSGIFRHTNHVRPKIPTIMLTYAQAHLSQPVETCHNRYLTDEHHH
jgi:hypothetical protein